MDVPAAAAHFLGYRYAHASGDNRFPVTPGPLPSALVWKPGHKPLIDCSTFVTACLVYMHPEVTWDRAAYADMQIMEATRLWSPLSAWERHGLGPAMAVGEMAQGWGVYQSWVDDTTTDGDPISGGHQWFYNGAMGVRVHSSSTGSAGPTWERVPFSKLLTRYKSGVRGVNLTT